MFKEMRRKDRELSKEESIKILNKCEYGILSTIGEDGYPYGIPLNYAFENNKLYFHCFVKSGHKLDNFKFCDKVSFTVVGDTKILPGEFSTDFESVIVFGKITEVTGEEKINPLKLLIKKFSAGFEFEGHKYIETDLDKTGVYEIEIKHLSGKAKR